MLLLLNLKPMDPHTPLAHGRHQHWGFQRTSVPFLWEIPGVQHILNPVYNAVTGHLFYYEIFQTCRQDAKKKYVDKRPCTHHPALSNLNIIPHLVLGIKQPR